MAAVHDTIKQQHRSNGRLQRTARIEEKVEAAEMVRSSVFRSIQLTLIYYNLPVSLSQSTNPITLITWFLSANYAIIVAKFQQGTI